MPELPEVETVVRSIRPKLCGRRIESFESYWPRQAAPTVEAVRAGLVGRSVTEVSRRAKWIVWSLDDGGHLLIHLRMSGRLEWDAGGMAHVRAEWRFSGGERLLFDDARKFGRIIYTRDLAADTAGLGVEPLARSFTPVLLKSLLRRCARQLKPLLLDQTVIAGLGNIYTDEALFRARLHPLDTSDRLDDSQIKLLHASIQRVLRDAIRNNGTSIDWIYPDGRMQHSLMVYGRSGEKCRDCGATIKRLIVGQRGTHICPGCQPARPKRANRRRAGAVKRKGAK